MAAALAVFVCSTEALQEGEPVSFNFDWKPASCDSSSAANDVSTWYRVLQDGFASANDDDNVKDVPTIRKAETQDLYDIDIPGYEHKQWDWIVTFPGADQAWPCKTQWLTKLGDEQSSPKPFRWVRSITVTACDESCKMTVAKFKDQIQKTKEAKGVRPITFFSISRREMSGEPVVGRKLKNDDATLTSYEVYNREKFTLKFEGPSRCPGHKSLGFTVKADPMGVVVDEVEDHYGGPERSVAWLGEVSSGDYILRVVEGGNEVSEARLKELVLQSVLKKPVEVTFQRRLEIVAILPWQADEPCSQLLFILSSDEASAEGSNGGSTSPSGSSNGGSSTMSSSGFSNTRPIMADYPVANMMERYSNNQTIGRVRNSTKASKQRKSTVSKLRESEHLGMAIGK